MKINKKHYKENIITNLIGNQFQDINTVVKYKCKEQLFLDISLSICSYSKIYLKIQSITQSQFLPKNKQSLTKSDCCLMW